MSLLNRLREVVDINRAIVSSLDYDEVLQLLMDKVATFANADRCVLLLADADGLVRVKASRGVDEERARTFGEPLDERINRALRSLLDYEGDDTFVGVPVFDHGVIRGVLAVHRREPPAPFSDDEYLLSALADQAAIALEHAARYQAAQRYGERKTRLLAAIQSATQSALAYLDETLRFREANAAYSRLAGIARPALLGRVYIEIIGNTRCLALIERARDSGQAGELKEMRIDDRFWDWFVCPVPEEGGVVISATEVTDRVQARQAAEEAARRKDEFLGMLSHELRNPLMPICNSLYVLERVPPESVEASQARKIIGRQTDHLVRLIDDLLDVTRITRGKIHLLRERLDLNALVENAVVDHRSIFTGRDLLLEHEVGDAPLPLEGDSTRLTQVIGNLLQNAAKFTPAGGRVWVSTRRQDERAILRVCDTGIGIPEEALERLFDPFAQAEATLDRSRGGLGLGLALVKGLVELHGGTVRASSAGSGCGAEFIVSLPLAGVEETPAEVAVSTPGGSRKRRRVLVIEDNLDGARSLVTLLSLAGHEMEMAHSGTEGLERARALKPDLVLCDIGLPGLDGYGVARAIREDPALRDTSSGFAQRLRPARGHPPLARGRLRSAPDQAGAAGGSAADPVRSLRLTPPTGRARDIRGPQGSAG